MTAQELKAENARQSCWLLQGFLSQPSFQSIVTLYLPCVHSLVRTFACLCALACPKTRGSRQCRSLSQDSKGQWPLNWISASCSCCSSVALPLKASSLWVHRLKGLPIKTVTFCDGSMETLAKTGALLRLIQQTSCWAVWIVIFVLCFPFSSLLTNCVFIDCVGKKRWPLWPVINLQTCTSFRQTTLKKTTQLLLLPCFIYVHFFQLPLGVSQTQILKRLLPVNSSLSSQSDCFVSCEALTLSAVIVALKVSRESRRMRWSLHILHPAKQKVTGCCKLAE